MMFVEWLGTQPGGKKGTCTAPSTIDRRISGTVVTARAGYGVRLEDGVARLARNRLKQLVKEMEEKGEARGRGQAPPLLVEHLAKISAACPDNLRGIRDRALVLMYFAVAGREHELAFNWVRDYAETPGGIQADLRVSKVRPPRRPGPLRLPALDLPGPRLAGMERGRRPHRPGRIRLAPPAQPMAHRHGQRAAARIHRRHRHPRRRTHRDRDPLRRP
ncbi:hypothetical protein ACFUV2_34295 [Streptomyces pilosus]|uniref:hypothetical protein n=1 Tax=Streptomyces pilosus TaxID=28893 RepID=UPI0036394889